MKLHNKSHVWAVAVIMLSGMVYIASCRHDNDLLISNGPKIERGTQKLSMTDPKVSYDKTHGNVQWGTAYLGGLSTLTGRFNSFGMTTFNFDESNAAGINFEAWVWINSVNTSEPGRDKGCLQTTFGTDTTMTTQTANVAILKSKSVELSTTDKGYIVKCDFTFHGVTKEITGKLMYDGVLTTGAGATLKYVYGFSFDFQFLAKTDYLITSNSIADKVDIKCNAIFRALP
ncbi:MAG: YceI family protein [Bacteroidota bacterium]|nr:YceI family protein [Bacteroidota bacterium]